jgi:hypothetical protein
MMNDIDLSKWTTAAKEKAGLIPARPRENRYGPIPTPVQQTTPPKPTETPNVELRGAALLRRPA